MNLWPFLPNRAQRAHLFSLLSNSAPVFVVHRWNEYKYDAPSLRPEELVKIDQAADAVVGSFITPTPARAILLQGHADYDLRKYGKAREDFEMHISLARSKEIRTHLNAAILRRINTAEAQTLYHMMLWRVEGLGSQRRKITLPQSEYEMSLNRRVEVFMAHSARRRQNPSIIKCLHGGTVMTKPNSGWNSPRDRWVVAGCTFVSNNKPSPCVKVVWHFVDDDIIDEQSIGECFNAQNESQGQVVIG